MLPEWMISLSDSFYECSQLFASEFRVFFGFAAFLFIFLFDLVFLFSFLYLLFKSVLKKILALWEKMKNG